MNPLGLVFILAGVFVMRQVWVNRVAEIPADVKDISLAVLNGNTRDIGEVFERRGNPKAPVAGEASTVAANDSPAIGTNSGSLVLNETVKLGEAANGYVWGATGPNSYDCSGIVWRALKNLNVYNGPRFTTHIFNTVAKGFATRVSAGNHRPGDIVNWPGDHMGVVASTDSYYSARSPAKGIGYAPLSSDVGYFGREPAVWRVR